MNTDDFDLNDIDNEPSDEQLAALMEAVAVEVRQRSADARADYLVRLRAQLRATAQDSRLHGQC
jgi:hypothetical protein